MIEELRRYSHGETFDEQPMPGLSSEALDFRAASESFAGVRDLARRYLEILRLVTDHQGRKVPTIGGMLLFGRDRERHFPDAWIQAGRFRGTGAPPLRSHNRRPASRHLKAKESCYRPCLPHPWFDRAVGQRRAAHDHSLPRDGARPATVRGDRHALSCYNLYCTCRVANAR